MPLRCSSERTLLLVDGSPQSGIVSQGDYAQYHFIVTPGVRPLSMLHLSALQPPFHYTTPFRSALFDPTLQPNSILVSKAGRLRFRQLPA